tara:strand:- start:872 stop:1594 length:723 start_codon:yes stop_codon:yes gene_type:complete
MSSFYFVKTTSKATLPVRQTTGSAGYDIYALNGGCVPASGKNTYVVDTGICIIMPKRFYGRIESRSSLAFKHCVTAFNGIIDSDFMREIKVQLINNGTDPFHYKPGDRIAQLIVNEYKSNVNDNVVKQRTGGFGSTDDEESSNTIHLSSYELNKLKIDTQFTENLMKHNKSSITTNAAYDIHELVNHYKAVNNINELEKLQKEKRELSLKAQKIEAWFAAKEHSNTQLTSNDYTKFLSTL